MRTRPRRSPRIAAVALALVLPCAALTAAAAASSSSGPVLPPLRPEAAADPDSHRLLVRVAGAPAAALAALSPAVKLNQLLFTDDSADEAAAASSTTSSPPPPRPLLAAQQAAAAARDGADPAAAAAAAKAAADAALADESRAQVEWALPLPPAASGAGRGRERALLAVSFAAQADADEALARLERKAARAASAAAASAAGGEAAPSSSLPPGTVLAVEADAPLQRVGDALAAAAAASAAAAAGSAASSPPSSSASSSYPGAVLGGGPAYSQTASAAASAAAAGAPFARACPSAATVGAAVRCLAQAVGGPRGAGGWWAVDAGGWRLRTFASEELKSAVETQVCARGGLLVASFSPGARDALPAAFSPAMGGPLACVLAVEVEDEGEGGGGSSPRPPATALAAGEALRLKNEAPAADGAQIARALHLGGGGGFERALADVRAALSDARGGRRRRALSLLL